MLKKIVFLVVLLFVAAIIFVSYRLFFHKQHYRIVGRYMDYDCQPVVSTDFQVSADLSSHVGFGGGAQYYAKGTTDERGYFEIDFKSRNHLSQMSIQANASDDGRSGARSFEPAPTMELLDTSFKNPLILYREGNATIEHRVTGRKLLAIAYRHDGGRFRIPVPRYWQKGQDIVFDVRLRWKREGGSWVLIIAAHKRGGFIDCPVAELPFNANIPSRGYRKFVRIPLPEADDRSQQYAFYYKHDGDLAFGTLFVNIKFDPDAMPRGALVNLTYDVLTSENEFVETPRLPQYNCGGPLAQSYDGYLGSLPANRNRFHRMLSKPRPGSDQRTAADPDTPLEWFQNQVDDRIVMAQALVSHGNVSERFALVYQVYREDLLRKLETKSFKDIHLDPNAMIFRIARREDAPLEILEDIEATFALAPLMLDLSSNPRLPQAMLNRLVEGLLGRDFESSGKNREVADILLKLAANPRLEAQAFAVLSKRIMENIDTDTVDYDYRRSAEILAGNPAVPAALLDDWANLTWSSFLIHPS